MGEEGAPSLETQLQAIAEKFEAASAPDAAERASAAKDLAGLTPVFNDELKKIHSAQMAAEEAGDSAGIVAGGKAASELQAKMCAARDFHMQRIADCDVKLSRLATARSLEEEAAKAAAAPPADEE